MAKQVRRKIKVSELALGRAVHGYAYPELRAIEVHTDLKGKQQLEIFAHEALHVICPYLEESTIDDAGKQLADVLWRVGYRRQK